MIVDGPQSVDKISTCIENFNNARQVLSKRSLARNARLLSNPGTKPPGKNDKGENPYPYSSIS